MQNCEEIFFNKPLVIEMDQRHSIYEKRFYCLGITDMGRKLFLVFTLRENKIRVISARNMSKNEKKEYAKYEEKNNPKV